MVIFKTRKVLLERSLPRIVTPIASIFCVTFRGIDTYQIAEYDRGNEINKSHISNLSSPQVGETAS